MKAQLYVPNNLNEITLRQYQKFVNLKDQDYNEIMIQKKMVSIFCMIKESEVDKIRYSDVENITSKLGEMFDQKPNLVKFFKVKGIEYGFIPNLDNISLGEYIDLDTYIGDWENIHRAMNVLYRPVQNKRQNQYVIEEYNGEMNNDILDMPLDAVISSVFFFYHLGRELEIVFQNYLTRLGEKQQADYHSLIKNGDGIAQFGDSLKGILQDLNISQN